MADANVAAIIGNPPPPLNPLQTISGWQQYANSVQQGKNLQLENQTGQQALATTMAQRHAQIMYGLQGLPDDQIQQGAQTALDDELKSGQIDQQRYNVMAQHIQGATPGQIRQTMTQGIISNLAGPEAVKAVTGSPVTIDNGGQFQGGTQAGPLSPNPGAVTGSGNVFQKLPGPQMTNLGGVTVPTSGGQVVGGALQNTPSPQFVNTGGANVPTSGGQQMGPGLNQTLNPGEATSLQPRMVQNPDGSYSVQTQQLGQWNPGMMPPGMKGSLPGNGGYPGPAPTSVPLGTEGQLESDQKAYQEDKQQVQPLITGTQSLGKALTALNAVATGAGTEGLAKMRSLAVSLGNVVGVDTGGTNVQDMNRALLEKYLTDYARQSASAGRSDEALNTAFKSNASGSINNAAAQDVVRTNIGRDRQKVAATMAQQNPQGSGYTANKANFNTTTDPRGFAWDSYTDAQKQQIIKETQGAQGANSPEYKKLTRAVGYASKFGLLDTSAPQTPNVNSSPTNAIATPPATQGNQLNGQQ